ncbi:MAG: metalloregulator ArsR/SmtB family transcription factor [Firmicutes bacterium]|nr:metalloregulator ArsR/SmtB family transcription factor [Bacillota bacterium]
MTEAPGRHEPSSGDQLLADVCKALSHPVRVQIIRILGARRLYCGDLVNYFGLAQSTISHHLKALREAGLLEGHDEGPSTCYSINRERYREFRTLIDHLV